MSETKPAALRPSSTVLLVRDGATGLEVFMVKRHHAIDFASGAMVFPGGKLAEGDSDPVLMGRHARPGKFAPHLTPFAFAAIREAFEESGLLLARQKGQSRLLSAEQASALGHWRDPLNRGEKTLRDMAEAEGIDFALDTLVPFAHWITPETMPKRFDTWFFLAAAPEGQIGAHDGGESVDSAWLGPQAALDDWEAQRRTIVFATRMQLVKLARASNVGAALAMAEQEPIVDVMPVLDRNAPGEPHLRIPAEAGYGVTGVPLSRVGM
ncbi:NUDIX hydrolase [uncultured Ferrovibrio sp.]|jgi:8-oxo-dGTP pyrophosphatase MutT (NUDIX family)|uniref:NUDIX hydrolase n=1 Tax=uncultured Ferrovibrio sp. TaxID=1576913 RepID=UPI00262E5365|nr:NUDIX hydrolase [uncultured Ferrovibrio sp.]